MSRVWETDFARWAEPPGKGEDERSERAIRSVKEAIAASARLRGHDVRVFVQGSYRNRVNVRRESDVDLGVLHVDDNFLFYYPPGKTSADFGNKAGNDYGFGTFKSDVEAALVAHFGRGAVTRGNKAINIRESQRQVEADVAPFYEFRHYLEDGSYHTGVALIPDSGGRIINFPERVLDSWPDVPLHYENGVSKNDNTKRRFKGVVRILKSLRNEMEEAGYAVAKPIPGYLLECLTHSAPDSCFAGETWDDIIQAVIIHIWSGTKDDAACKDWCEVDQIKFLFRPSKPWARPAAYAFIDAAWSYVGVR